MPKLPFSEIFIPVQRRYKNKGFIKKPNTGIDSETYKGYTKLLCDSSGRYKFVSSFEDCLNFLSHKYFRNSFNWFFNLEYDLESMLKFLDLRKLKKIYTEHKLEYNHYKLFYIPKKFLAVKIYHDHYYFYDINNFLETSLNIASKKYLKKSKLDIIDATKLNTDLNYWKKYENQIIKYCLQDALLTKEIADYFWNLMYNTLKFYPKRPFSKGKFSEEYFLSKCYVPTINDIPVQVLNMAWNNYSGGRFELLKRGSFKKCYIYDIKSAYPAILKDLIDYNIGNWSFTEKYDKEADLSYHNVLVNFYDMNFSPFMERTGSINIYPNGKYYQVLNNFEIDFIQKNFKNCEMKIEEGVKFYIIKEKFPYKDEIEFLYNWKEKEKDEDIKYCLKILMNSYYGKKVSAINGIASKSFNPIEGSLITSLTRLKLMELGLQKPDKIIAFSTDSVSSIEPLIVPKYPKIGEFNFEFEGEGNYVMSDIYSLIGKDKKGKEKRKDKFRGFTIINEEKQVTEIEYTIGYILERMKEEGITVFKYSRKRPYHLGECLTHVKKRTKEDINIFEEHKKKIDINGDKKRIWERNFDSAKDALENNMNSLPLLVKYFS